MLAFAEHHNSDTWREFAANLKANAEQVVQKQKFDRELKEKQMKASESLMIHAVDRYSATGTPYPDPETMCAGPCEGMGVYPQFLAGAWLKPSAARLEVSEEVNAKEIERWHEAHMLSDHPAEKDKDGIYQERQCDGWHFITCPDCEGTGKAIE